MSLNDLIALAEDKPRLPLANEPVIRLMNDQHLYVVSNDIATGLTWVTPKGSGEEYSVPTARFWDFYKSALYSS